MFRKIDEIEKWLQNIEEQIPKEDECKITDSAELYQTKVKFQTLKDKCDDKTQEFRNLNEASEYNCMSSRSVATALRLPTIGLFHKLKVLQRVIRRAMFEI